jgi:hypothetical protein
MEFARVQPHSSVVHIATCLNAYNIGTDRTENASSNTSAIDVSRGYRSDRLQIAIPLLLPYGHYLAKAVSSVSLHLCLK